MLRICMQFADLVEQQVVQVLVLLITRIEEVCRTITEQIEQWEKRFEQRCEEVRRQVCRWLPWPLDKLCDWVTETVCNLVEVLVKVVTTIVKTVCEVITSIIRIIVRIITTIFVVVLRFVCFWIDFIINWIKIIIAIVVGLPEFLLCLLGLRIRKHLHVCVTVLADREGQPVMPDVQVSAVMREATRIISDHMNVRVHEHGRRIIRVDDRNLDVVACSAKQLFSADAVDLSAESQRSGRFSDLLGCGDNVLDQAGELLHDVLNVIFIRNIIEGDDIGCHIPGTDYVIIDQSANGLTLAHEIGHAGDLWHVSEEQNLMNHFTAGEEVHSWQACIFRRSRFVVYAP
jgi:hypothetical protein